MKKAQRWFGRPHRITASRRRAGRLLSLPQVLERREMLDGAALDEPAELGPAHAEVTTVITPLPIEADQTAEVALAVSATFAQQARDALLAGVSQVAVVGSPGRIAIFEPIDSASGEGAFSVIHDGKYQSMVAAAVWGAGRVVAMGHNGYTDFSAAGGSLDTGRFYENSVGWVANDASRSVAIVTPTAGTRTWLLSRGYTNVVVRSDWENALGTADVLVAELGRSVSAAKRAALAAFVEAGGGLITGGTGWGYKQLGSDLVTMDGNVALRAAGLGWADGFREATTTATRRSGTLANATEALAFAEQVWTGAIGSTSAQRAEAGVALETALAVLPADHPLRLSADLAFAGRAGVVRATPSTPVSSALDKAVLRWESDRLEQTPVTAVVAHPSAAAVYGAIPAGAPRVTSTVTLNPTQSRWQATGLYAAPGERVTVTVPASLVGRGYQVRIGAHTDDIGTRDSWERMPVVHRAFTITQTTFDVASAFGGAIFFDFGAAAPGGPTPVVTLSGAVEHPYFVLGRHTNAEWAASLRGKPGPYAVLVSPRAVIVLPKRQVESANLSDPEALLAWWDETVRLQDDLAAQSAFRTSPELINVDVQNSAGAAHAGYPIQAYEKFWGNLADWPKLQRDGSWGDFHELGHNHQRSWWTFDGDTEVSVNIFSNYALETLNPNTAEAGWGWSVDPLAVIQRAIGDVASGGGYSTKANRWSFWFQLADGFGWETYQQVFAGYEADARTRPLALPTSNQQEKDQWFTRWSQAVGYDMKRFMVDTWGLEVSAGAQAAVAALPDWMPLAHRTANFSIQRAGSLELALGTAGVGMDGAATLESVGGPVVGTFVSLGGGRYRYTAPFGAQTEDSFTVTYRSSAGNTQTFTVNVAVTSNGFPVGDYDSDGQVGLSDRDQWALSYGATSRGRRLSADGNGDGLVDAADYAIWRDAYDEALATLARTSAPALTVAAGPAVAEPAIEPPTLGEIREAATLAATPARQSSVAPRGARPRVGDVTLAATAVNRLREATVDQPQVEEQDRSHDDWEGARRHSTSQRSAWRGVIGRALASAMVTIR